MMRIPELMEYYFRSNLRNGLMSWSELEGLWLDCGSFDSLFEANRVVAEARRKGDERFRPLAPSADT